MKSTIKNSLFMVALAVGAVGISHAQVKIGKSPTTVLPNANLEIQAENDQRIIANKATGSLTVEQTSSAPSNGRDSILTRGLDGEIHQIGRSRLRSVLQDIELPKRGKYPFTGSPITFSHPASAVSSVIPNTFTPVPVAGGGTASINIVNESATEKVYAVIASYNYDGLDWSDNVSFIRTLWTIFLDGNDTDLHMFSEISPASVVNANGIRISGQTSVTGTITGYIRVLPGIHTFSLRYRGEGFSGVVGSNYTIANLAGEQGVRLEYLQMY